MKLEDVVERTRYLIVIVICLGGFVTLLDYFNPFMDFSRSWNMHYVVNHLAEFMLPLIPIYFVLGCIAKEDDSLRVLLSSFWIPVLHYLFKGLIFLYLIGQDPNLPNVVGVWFGGYVLNWQDFAVVYLATSYLFYWSIGRICIALVFLGVIVNYIFGNSIIKPSVRWILQRLGRRKDGFFKVLVT